MVSILRLAEEGKLTARVTAALAWDNNGDESQVELFNEKRALATSSTIQAGTVKIVYDGVCENFTAAMLEPYLDEDGQPTNNRGKSFGLRPMILSVT